MALRWTPVVAFEAALLSMKYTGSSNAMVVLFPAETDAYAISVLRACL